MIRDDIAARARGLVGTIQAQNWKRGGVLATDTPEACALAERALLDAHNAAVEAAKEKVQNARFGESDPDLRAIISEINCLRLPEGKDGG